MTDIFQIAALIDGVRTLKNNSLRITIETQDTSCFTAEELATLFKLTDKHVHVAIKESEVKPEDLDIKEVVDFKGEKSPSQRLRNTLFVYWTQNKPTADFETYYRTMIEKFISTIKDKLL